MARWAILGLAKLNLPTKQKFLNKINKKHFCDVILTITFGKNNFFLDSGQIFFSTILVGLNRIKEKKIGTYKSPKSLIGS